MSFVNSSPYFGKTRQQMMLRFMASPITLNYGLAQILDNVKGRMNLPYLTDVLNIRERDCDFTPGGSSTLSNKTIDVKVYEDQTDFCKVTLQKLYDNSGMFYIAPGVPNVPNALVDYAIAQRLQKLQGNWDNIIWNSDTLLGADPTVALNLQDGFTKLIHAGSPVNVGTGAITSVNVIDVFQDVVSGMGDVLTQEVNLGNTGVYMVTSYAVLTLLRNALAAIPLAQHGNFERKDWISPSGAVLTNIWHLAGIPVVGIPNFRANTIFLTHYEMMFIGTDVSPENMYIDTIDFETTTFANKIGFKFAWVLGMQISNQSNLMVEYYT